MRVIVDRGGVDHLCVTDRGDGDDGHVETTQKRRLGTEQFVADAAKDVLGQQQGYTDLESALHAGRF